MLMYCKRVCPLYRLKTDKDVRLIIFKGIASGYVIWMRGYKNI